MSDEAGVTLRAIVAVSQREVDEAGGIEEAALASLRHGGLLDAEVLDDGGLRDSAEARGQ